MLKRIFDLFLVIPGLVFLLPIFAVVALWIRFDSKGPVFFRQKRVGQHGCPFYIYKFRTMIENAERKGARITIGEDPRITSSGHFLRKTKLDELPQLLNILKGEMSFVGPRPEVQEYVEYWPEDKRSLILSVPPGMTDYAAIEFRNESQILGESEDAVETYIHKIIPIKLEMYEFYVNNRSIALDVWLILRTIANIFRE